jgi:hypothetical protein
MPVAVVDLFATEALARGLNRALATLQAQVQRRTVVAGGADRQRLLAPFGELVQGMQGVHFQAQTEYLARFGQYLERHFGEQAEAAEAAGHQA